MDEKQTRCPNCDSIYKVTVTQLTVAQGMVCCPKCSHQFNALLHLENLVPEVTITTGTTIVEDPHTSFQNTIPSETNLLDIFNRKAEHSNINLRTYLNNLNYFNNETINNIPSLNLSEGYRVASKTQNNARSKLYYVAWSFINIALLLILVFQVLWFNPNILDKYPTLNTFITKSCSYLNCQTIDQRYMQIKVDKLKVTAINQRQTQFSGQLSNTYTKSLELPNIRVTLKSHGSIVNSYVMTPSEYLIDSLMGIKRIPQNSPYPFKFLIEQSKNSFEEYQLDILHP